MWEGRISLVYHTTWLLNIVALLCVTLSMSSSNNTSLQITRHPNCTDTCGSVSIPYPFGIEDGCYYVDPVEISYYNLTCNYSTTPPSLLFGNIVVVNITLDGEIQMLGNVSYDCHSYSNFNSSSRTISSWEFTISTNKNSLVAIGCDTTAWFYGTSIKYTSPLQSGCITICSEEQVDISDGTCSGIGCCKAFLPSGMKRIDITAKSYNNHSTVQHFNPCSVAFVVANDAMPSYRDLLSKSAADLNILSYPILYSWSIGTKNCTASKADNDCVCQGHSRCLDMEDQVGYRCECNPGFQGYPYLNDCQDVDECVQDSLNSCLKPALCVNTFGSYYCSCPQGYRGNGTISDPCIQNYRSRYKLLVGISVTLGLILFSLAGWWLYIMIRKRKARKQRAKYFKKNGGELLLEQQKASDGSTRTIIKFFTCDELEKATDDFNNERILGEGGQGTVYKGMLSEGRLVAIKKSKMVDENRIGEFITEVVILSQINHRNIVKLLGCCLETELPLLVYEFIPNGTLFQHIHNPSEEFAITWRMRLQIASDSAGALAYLHSSSSIPILHRDIKSTNILLDEKYKAKVSDFGTSKSIDVDKTHVTTRVIGTFGYVDPEYFQSSQFTEKSDVYSFGVVLVELLTGQRALRPTKENINLATWFLSRFENSNLIDIIDTKLLNEGSEEEFYAIASLAKQCLKLDGRSRPTMKEVLIKIETVLSLHLPLQNSPKPRDVLTSAAIQPYDEISASSTFYLETNTASSTEVSLLFNPK